MEASTVDERSTAVRVRATLLPDPNAEGEEVSMHEEFKEVKKGNEVTAEEHLETNDDDKFSMENTFVASRVTDISNYDHSLMASPFNQLNKKETGSEADACQNLPVPIKEQSIDLREGNNPGSSSSSRRRCRCMKKSSKCYENAKELRTFKKLGEIIADRSIQLHRLTGCNIYYRAQYTPPSGVTYRYCTGQYFRLPEAEEEASSNSSASVVFRVHPSLPTLVAQKLPGDPVELPFVPPPSTQLQPVPDPVSSRKPCSRCKKIIEIIDEMKKIDLILRHNITYCWS